MSEIMIVDDERILRESLKANLLAEGYQVRTARDGEEALKKMAEKLPDLVLLDVMMPKMNGFCCCEAIRKMDKTLPVIFLTAKDAECDQVRGLGLGADDYISKTASDAVLLARVSRALSRVRELCASEGKGEEDVLRLGPVAVDLKSCAVRFEGKEQAVLTKTELDLLQLLWTRRGDWLLVDDLITELRGNGFACEDAMLYVHLSHLRRKLGPAGNSLVHKRGLGYSLG